MLFRDGREETRQPDVCCIRHPGIDRERCPGVRACLENGEPWDARCESCNVGKPEMCPELDPLSRKALVFSAWWDHEAHAGYRAEMLDMIGPVIEPYEAWDFILRRQIVYETNRVIARREARRKAARHGSSSKADN